MDGAAQYRDWIGRTQIVRDVMTPSPLVRLAATLDRDDPAPHLGDEIPPGWHWLYFLEAVPPHATGPDGHALRGRFLPPITLPRRMWAGGRFEFLAPLRVGDEILRKSEIADVAAKEGRSGPLVICTLRHSLIGPRGLALREEQSLVYRAAPAPGERPVPPEVPPAAAEFGRTIAPDPVLLFRFSALTFNGHRIHYDHPYATQVEGYPGLVVHGPLLAILLLDLARRERPAARMSQFHYRALRPVFATTPFRIAGKAAGDRLLLWARDNDGALAMRAEAWLAS
jgi:3-methylfumaryl-CoA hydratase